jgi:hypothetical protein
MEILHYVKMNVNMNIIIQQLKKLNVIAFHKLMRLKLNIILLLVNLIQQY